MFEMTSTRRTVAVSLLAAIVLLVTAAGSALGQETTEPPTTTTVVVEPSEGSTETTAAPAGESTGDTAGQADVTSIVAPAPEDLAVLNPNLTLDQLTLQFWPEYDTSDVLVMADLRLPADVQFPVEMQVAIPAGARLTGVAEVTSDGSFDYSRPAPTPNLDAGTEQWDVYNLIIPKIRDVRVEYYYDPGVNTAGQRSYSLAYRLPMDAAQVVVSAQQPLRATEFAVTPPLSDSSSDAQGFTYYSETLGAVDANQLIQLQLDYAKPDADPSVNAAGGEDAATGSNSSLLLWVIGLVALGTLGFVAYRLFLRPAPVTASRARSKSRGSKGRTQERSGGPGRFCTNCGAKLNKRDRFCPECGEERE